jgi:ribonuclease P protein component
VVAGKRTGNAVQRNRIKRRLRAAIEITGLPAGSDFVLLAGPEVATVKFDTLLAWLPRSSE